MSASPAFILLQDPQTDTARRCARVARGLAGAAHQIVSAGPTSLGQTGDLIRHRGTWLAVSGRQPRLDGSTSAARDLIADVLAGHDPESLGRLRGPFSFVAMGADGHAIALRDPFGHGGLFAQTCGMRAVMASELTPLLESLDRRPGPDPIAIRRWLAGQPMGLRTLFAGVAPFPPGHLAQLRTGRVRARRVWSVAPVAGLAQVSFAEAADALRSGVELAVARASGERTAVLLSGGLDSGALLAIAAARARRQGAPAPLALTAVFPDHPEMDERAYSRPVAERLGISVEEIALRPRPLMRDIAAHIRRWSVPPDVPNVLLFAELREAAAAAGCDVVLDGEGGDELFGCSPALIADRLAAGRPVAAWRLACRLPGTGGRLTRRTARIVARQWVLPALVHPHPRIESTSAPPRRPSGRWRAALVHDVVESGWPMAVGDTLRRAAAAHGVDGAHPFMDPELLDLVLGLPPEHAFDPSRDRPLLREAVRGELPEDARQRVGKTTFNNLVEESVSGLAGTEIQAVIDRPSPQLRAWVPDGSWQALRTQPAAGSRYAPAGWLLGRFRVAALARWLAMEEVAQKDPDVSSISPP